jgi:hypothetical protein
MPRLIGRGRRHSCNVTKLAARAPVEPHVRRLCLYESILSSFPLRSASPLINTFSELEHFSVGSPLAEESQTRHEPVVKSAECRRGQFIDSDFQRSPAGSKEVRSRMWFLSDPSVA